MKNKATIITFHAVQNYGAIMQAYGLQEVLSRYFNEVEFLDYRPKSVYDSYKLIQTATVPSLLRSILTLKTRLKKKNRFFKFFKTNLKFSEVKSEEPTLFSDYHTDFLFLGSDQIWNPEITKGFDSVYFGDFLDTKNIKVISYAASFGSSSFIDEERSCISEYIKKIDTLSVREDAAKDLLKSMGYVADVVADPTILAGAESYKKHLASIKESKYVLLFSLSKNDENVKHATKIAKYLGLELIEVTNGRKPLLKRGRKIIYDAGPREFLSYIYNAEYVVTDSFHGTVFSILFHRPFSTIIHKTRGERMRTLLKSVGLTNRLSCGFDKQLLRDSIDWEKVESKLAGLRGESLRFIERSIKDDK